MPELPEVETVVLGMRPLIKGLSFVSASSNTPKSFPNSQGNVDAFLLGATVLGVSREGKAIIVDLSTNYSLVIHLKMTGQLIFRSDNNDWGGGHPNDSFVSALPDKSTRVEFDLSGSAKLFFNDQRKFGWVRLLPTIEVPEINFMKTLGPDALTITGQEFESRINKRKKSIKACLLDQTIVAGCGNIYADESLWMTKLHPSTHACDVPAKKLIELHDNLQKILNLSISLGGSSSKNYVNAKGERGSYLEFANVYMRKGKPCNRCGTEIERIVVVTRGTHICPSCQKAPK